MSIVTNNTMDGDFEEKTVFKSSRYLNNRGKIETIRSQFTFFYGRWEIALYSPWSTLNKSND